MTLARLQAELAARVQGRGTASEVEARVVDRLPGAGARLAIYRELVEEAHLDALSTAFPVTAAVLGAAPWRTLIRAGWEGPGSGEADLGHYGAFVPALLRRAVAARSELADYDYLPELALLEWSVHEAVARTGPERLDLPAFAALDPELQTRVRLVPSPVLARVDLRAPVDEIWRRHQGQAPRESTEAGPFTCLLHPQGRFGVGVLRWPVHEAALLAALLGGPTLAELDGLGLDATRLREWIEAGWLVDFARA